ncbi:partial Endo-1,4-beta-xylanase A, partial [Gammaproteobacteria bacterium]
MTNTTDLDRAIRQHRTTQATVTVTHHGAPLIGQDVVVQQRQHRFLLGSNWGERTLAWANGELTGLEKERTERRNDQFLQLFNQVTLPFYWGRFEPLRGQPQTDRIRNAARWYQAQGCVLKGHPLCWHTLAPDWLLPLDNQSILQAQIARIQREMSDFAGVIEMWDVVNEAVIMPIFDRYDNGLTRICKEL